MPWSYAYHLINCQFFLLILTNKENYITEPTFRDKKIKLLSAIIIQVNLSLEIDLVGKTKASH